MTDKQTQVFTKCLSEAEVREADLPWQDQKKKCTSTHSSPNYYNVQDIKSIFKKGEHGDLQNLIEHIAKLTVRIEIPIKSKEVNKYSVFGTGFIQRVRKITKTRKSGNGSTEGEDICKFGVLTISTVHHVLYPSKLKEGEKVDFSEASIRIGYDSDERGYEEAKTFTIVESDKDINTYDWCSFECSTEDLGLIERLSAFISTLEDEQLEAYRKYNELKQNEETDQMKTPPSKKDSGQTDQKSATEAEKVTDFIVVVGHPHGGPKQVSTGREKKPKEILKQVRDQQEWCCYYHDAETCTGSSGSPVFIFGQPLCGYGYWFGHAHNHSGRISDDLKVTSIGVDHIVIVKGQSK